MTTADAAEGPASSSIPYQQMEPSITPQTSQNQKQNQNNNGAIRATANTTAASSSFDYNDTNHSNINYKNYPPPPKQLEQVFLTMHYRKMQRDLNGPQRKKTKYHFIALACLLILVYGLSAYSVKQEEMMEMEEELTSDGGGGNNNGDGSGNDNNGEQSKIAISLTFDQIILIGIWIFLSILITAIFGSDSKFIVLLYWMLVYWPLLAMLTSLLIFRGEGNILFGGTDESVILAVGFIIVEVVTLLSFVVINYIYPKLVTSRWFREKYSPTRFWNIKLIEYRDDDNNRSLNGSATSATEEEQQPQQISSKRVTFSMQYDGIWGCLSRNRYHCRYVGEVNDAGLPHGQGVWSDDSYTGEVLTGTWDNGNPVAPFSSRQYGGKGNTFSAKRLAYFMATDDSFEANKLVPTNDEPPRCGVASVECSIAGDFMSHLPEAALVGGEPQIEGGSSNDDGGGMTIGTCCRELDNGITSAIQASSSSDEKPITSLQINSNDLRGVAIDGHLAPTGLPFTRRVKQIIINVTRVGPEYEELDSITAEVTNDDDEEALQIKDAVEDNKEERQKASSRDAMFRLDVKDWTRVGTKDALIFIPGFNSWLKHSLETFGQMMAMTRMSQNVYPILFAWPGAQVLSYRQASFISASENNRKYFLQMLRSLQAEGIQNIHIVTHSKGVETLMAAFEDSTDGTPSLVSQCFGPAPAYGDTPTSVVSDLGGKLVCRSITMLNPDFPVYAFRERGFRSLRRVASLITVVGDKADQALFWSSLINGICNSLGCAQPSMCDSKARQEESGFHLQQPIGKNIDLLYVEAGTDLGNEAMVLQHRAGSIPSQSLTPPPKKDKKKSGGGGAALSPRKKIWLDCDVIDTTGLDTNVNNLRHSAYNVNSILLRDIEELIVTGKRASERTTTLHKKGNVYEYCHAPAFVKM